VNVNNSKHLTPKQRRLRNREEMTAAIVQTARDIMREQGVAALNLNEIARRLGMQTPSLYEYFPNKMALYDQLFLVGVRLSDEGLTGIIERYGATWEGIEALFRSYLEFAQEYPELFQLVFERHVPGFEPSEATMNESWEMLAKVSQYLQTIIQAGLIQAALPMDQVRDLVFALMHGLVAQHMANEPHLPLGAGRYGSLIPLAVQLLRKAWGNDPDTLPSSPVDLGEGT
jgi:AcrR family transcriptional regulator